jgi:nucleoside-diphosphate-sugar epimerase
MTALAGASDMRHFDRVFATTNRLRTEGTAHLLEGARAVGTRRLVVQGYTGWPFARTGGPVKDEDAPLDDQPPHAQRATLAAMREMESLVTDEGTGVDGVVLRYGALYGPGTSLAADGEVTQLVRRRRLPVIGDGAGRWSFTHIDDAAGGVVAALAPGAPAGVFAIVDDEPAATAEWIPELAAAVGARPPRHVPAWVGRLAAGEAAATMMTESRGASNARARSVLGWAPRHPTWREGFRQAL